MNKIIELKSDTEMREKVASSKSMVEIFSFDCVACNRMEQVVDDLAKEVEGIQFFKLNIDNVSDSNFLDYYGSKVKITAIPTFLLFQDGEFIREYVGATSQDMLKQWLIDK